MGVFGSVARGEDTATSDVDLLVDLEERVGLPDLIGLERLSRTVFMVDADEVAPTSRCCNRCSTTPPRS